MVINHTHTRARTHTHTHAHTHMQTHTNHLEEPATKVYLLLHIIVTLLIETGQG